MTLAGLLEARSVFSSTVWADFISYIRDLLDLDPYSDPPAQTYPINTVDSNLMVHYGDLELMPGLYTIASDGTETINTTAVTMSIDAIIGKNLQYWKRLADSLLAEFDPLYNVDAHETTTTQYGQHVTQDAKGQRQRTDVHGAQDISVGYGEKTITEGQRSDSRTNGAQNITTSETTMDNTATYTPRTKEEHAAISDSATKGQQINTEGSHTDRTQTTQYSDTSTDNAVTDTLTSQTHTDTVTIRRYGNIGVTMSTQLLSDFQRFARESDLVGIIAAELAKELTFGVWY